MPTTFKDGSVTAVITKSGGVISGVIVPFSGTFEAGYPIDRNTGKPDKEWHLCDGTQGTPDLRGKFLLAGNGGNTGDTGGSDNVTHAHLTAMGFDDNGVFFGYGGNTNELAFGSKVFNNTHVMTAYKDSSSTNGSVRVAYTESQTLSTMPPYYVISYIMKL